MNLPVLKDRWKLAARRAVRIKAKLGRRYGHNKSLWPASDLRHYNAVKKAARDLQDQIKLIEQNRG